MKRIHCDAEGCKNNAPPALDQPNGMPEAWALIIFVRMAEPDDKMLDPGVKFSADMMRVGIKEMQKGGAGALSGEIELPTLPPQPMQLYAHFCPACADKLPIASLERGGRNVFLG